MEQFGSLVKFRQAVYDNDLRSGLAQAVTLLETRFRIMLVTICGRIRALDVGASHCWSHIWCLDLLRKTHQQTLEPSPYLTMRGRLGILP